MDSVAYLADGFVFRFPKVERASRKYELEVALLPHLQGRSPLTTPMISYAGCGVRSGLRVVGHPCLQGIPLAEASVAMMSRDRIDVVARPLTEFLDSLRRFPIEVAIGAGADGTPFRLAYDIDFQRARAEVYPLLDEPRRQYIEPLFDTYLGDDRNFINPPSLLHGDLWPEHILCDTTGKPVAIIDFSDMAVGDPDFDLMQIHGTCDRELVRAIAEGLGTSFGSGLSDKLEFYFRANAVKDVLAGIDRGDEEMTKLALDEVRRHADDLRINRSRQM